MIPMRIGKVQVVYRYEKICDVCLYCGMLGHEHFSRELDRAWGEEEIYWKDRAKLKALKEGDRNTKYFHARAMIRRRKSRILGLEDEQGVWREGEDQVEGGSAPLF
ncbi:hypothetical protein LIER_29998 [Lithospermum erythrorhizon]|uniref:Uncharacterized protein n=1 Tax=Lithospermum erythrorhizon TaxID=34254 RepID=A0AAV3RN11_LITER